MRFLKTFSKFITTIYHKIIRIKKMTTEMTTDASQPRYNTSLLLGGDEQLKKIR